MSAPCHWLSRTIGAVDVAIVVARNFHAIHGQVALIESLAPRLEKRCEVLGMRVVAYEHLTLALIPDEAANGVVGKWVSHAVEQLVDSVAEPLGDYVGFYVIEFVG